MRNLPFYEDVPVIDGAGRVPKTTDIFVLWLFRITVMLTVCPGAVNSSRYVDKSSEFLILAPLMAIKDVAA